MFVGASLQVWASGDGSLWPRDWLSKDLPVFPFLFLSFFFPFFFLLSLTPPPPFRTSESLLLKLEPSKKIHGNPMPKILKILPLLGAIY